MAVIDAQMKHTGLLTLILLSSLFSPTVGAHSFSKGGTHAAHTAFVLLVQESRFGHRHVIHFHKEPWKL